MLSFSEVTIGYNGTHSMNIPDVVLPESGIVCILGKNGAGKTTLFKTLTADISVLSGTILVDNKSISSYNISALAKKMCYIPQSINVGANIRAITWVLMGGAHSIGMFSNPTRGALEAAEYAMSLVGISSMKERDLSTLSGGELRKVALARALYQDSSIVLLDELFGPLDIYSTLQVRELLQEAALNRLIVLTTHDIQMAMKTADYVVLMCSNGEAKVAKPGDIDQDMLASVYGIQFSSMVEKVSTVGKDWVIY